MLVFLIFFVFIKNGPTINHDITLHLHAQLKPKEEQKNVAFFMLDLVNPRGNRQHYKHHPVHMYVVISFFCQSAEYSTMHPLYLGVGIYDIEAWNI